VVLTAVEMMIVAAVEMVVVAVAESYLNFEAHFEIVEKT